MTVIAQTNIPCKITKQDGSTISGNVRWYSASKSYLMELADSSTNIPISEVHILQVKRPENLDISVKMYGKGDYTNAVTILERTLDDYTMLQWDHTAAMWLAKCHLRSGRDDRAVALFDRIGHTLVLGDDELRALYDEKIRKPQQIGAR
jgi:hypothetical protein